VAASRKQVGEFQLKTVTFGWLLSTGNPFAQERHWIRPVVDIDDAAARLCLSLGAER
jgi:hypothetical protein